MRAEPSAWGRPACAVLLGPVIALSLGLASAVAVAAPAVAPAAARSKAEPAAPIRSPQDEAALNHLFVDAINSRSVPAAYALQNHTCAFRGSEQRTDLAHKGDKTLFINRNGHYKVARGSKEWHVDEDNNLDHFGIGQVAHVEKLLIQKLREAAGTDAPADAGADELIKIVNLKSEAARDHLSAIKDRADAKLLRDYQYEVLRPQRNGSRSDCWTELLTGDDSLKISYWGGLVASSGGPERTVGLRDLERLGVSTTEQFDAILAKRVIATAGLKGNEPGALDRARAKLKAQIEHAR